MRLKDKVAVITGAARGIGAAFAVGFGKEGAKIVIGDILDGKETVDAVEKSGSKAIFVRTDVSKQDQCDALAKAAMDRFGSIDILVNNAGIVDSIILRPFTEITTEEWMRVIEVNTTAPFHCTKAVFPYMKGKGGKIINISSASIFEGLAGMAHYVASKGAIMAFTRSIARELGPYNINVNTIAPGFTHTHGTDKFGPFDEIQMPLRCLKKAAYPEDLVGTALFLATDDSKLITGQLIVHDGGMSFH
jgi:NAD(P)-dependent dehydrogenase (short-subunit alcohol dehydrogenase family)